MVRPVHRAVLVLHVHNIVVKQALLLPLKVWIRSRCCYCIRACQIIVDCVQIINSDDVRMFCQESNKYSVMYASFLGCRSS